MAATRVCEKDAKNTSGRNSAGDKQIKGDVK
jgi:hypothetical protein